MTEDQEIIDSDPAPERITAGPTLDSERIDSLDILRGFALLGILIMNIQSFSMPSVAYFFPEYFGALDGLNGLVWHLGHVFVELKFQTMFCIMFGAGIVLMSEHRDASGKPVLSVHYRRMSLLLAVGLIHAYLIWYGDILTLYAICGMFVVWCRKWQPRTLAIVGSILILVGSVFFALLAIGANYSEEVADGMRQGIASTEDGLQDEVEAYLGTWIDHLPFRAIEAAGIHFFVFPFMFFWRLCGLMCIGMALYKWKILSAKRSPKFYLITVIIGGAIGIPLSHLSAISIIQHESDPAYVLGLGSLKSYYTSLPMAAMWISLIMLMCKSTLFSRTKFLLASYGRMAFTNYIGQSLLATWIFYGYGLGLFGSVSRVEQLGIVLIIWSVQLAFSPLWLKYFKFGPLEWLWRSGVYMKPQPMLRRSSPT